MSFAYRRQIVIDPTKCGSVDSSNFVFLFSGTYTWLATIANTNGQIFNTVSSNGVTIPADLAFYSDQFLTSRLPFEIASYSSSTGKIEAWVQVSTLSHTTPTVLYIAYGDANQTSDLSGFGSGTNPWDSNYRAVWHLGDGTTLNLNDSTSNNNNLTNNNT